MYIDRWGLEVTFQGS